MGRLRVRTLIVLVVLVPTLGLVAQASIAAADSWNTRQAAKQLEADANALATLTDASAALAAEANPSQALAIAREMGVGADELSAVYDVDFPAQLAEARAVVDANPTLTTSPTLAPRYEELQELRAAIDGNSAQFAEINEHFNAFTGDIDALWLDQFDQLERLTAAWAQPGSVNDRVAALEDTFHALTTGGTRLRHAAELLIADTPQESVTSLLEEASRFTTRTNGIEERLGSEGTSAWRTLQAEPGTQRLEDALEKLLERGLDRGAGALDDAEIAGYGSALVDGSQWASGLTDVVSAAADDLQSLAGEEASVAHRALLTDVAIAAALTVISLAVALLLARGLTGPIRRLGAAAHTVQQGEFDVAPLVVHGPKELADSAKAFNDMTSTLAAVEAHAVALATDPESPVHAEPLPGRTGRAMQQALNKLRWSIRSAEKHRVQLQELASHDSLTGLVNRRTAFERLERDIERARREDAPMMGLFIDLDGLKPINDTFGHDAGDRAIRAVADVLRATTRATDVTGRLGGDEFLVAGIAEGSAAEVARLAERIHGAIDNIVLQHGDEQIPLGCSIGVAISDPHGLTVDALVRKADAALYEAKRRGRDQVYRDGTGVEATS